MKSVSEPSPLFDKMDALLARHRGGAAGTEEIPVLVDEADDIPVLTEAVDESWPDTEALMFPPEEFMAAPVAPVPAPAPPAPAPAPAEFLDLPLLDLDALSQANPWGADWEEEIIPGPAPESWPGTELAAMDLLAGELILPERLPADGADFAPEITLPAAVVTAIPVAGAEPVAKVAQIIEFQQIADAAKPVASLQIPGSAALTETTIISSPESEVADPVTESAISEVAIAVPLSEPAISEVAIAEALSEPAVSEPVVALSDPAIAELTAMVAAQLGVEIATEVEQLTRQHFASLMHRFYEDSLRQLTAEISQDMESRLQARVASLIKEELKKSGF